MTGMSADDKRKWDVARSTSGMEPAMRRLFTLLCMTVAALIALAASRDALAQGTTEPAIRDSNVGYIDPAIPGDIFRFRYDAAYQNTTPTRDEFFWAPGGRFGPGPTFPETNVDYQDLQFYLEQMIAPRASAFIELPVRFLNPVQNPNEAGVADMNAGVKYAFIENEDLVATFQLRTYAPTGNVHEGLGNSHASLEPALLVYKPLCDGWVTELELRDWIPLGGNDFAGNIIRYGIGLHYDDLCCGCCQVVPIAEIVGWTSLGGKVTVAEPGQTPFVESAAGQTIVNIKLGMRFKTGDRGDIYMGYGRPLTGDTWYQNTFRIELRWFL
jgi:hypothetical protein